MADALCGPSNPLQQFKQQTSLDRTLQQDRLASRHSPTQGFRSQDPNAGLLDREFEAFQAGLPAPDLPQFQRQPFPQQQHHGFSGGSQAPSWASDFQRMHLSPPPSLQQQRAPKTSNWAQGFQQHIAQQAPQVRQNTSSPSAFQQRARYGLSGFQSSFAPNVQSPGLQQHQQRGTGKEMAMEQFDDAAFERAFDAARNDIMAEAETAMQEHVGQEGTMPAQAKVEQEVLVELRELKAKMDATFANDVSLGMSDVEMEEQIRREQDRTMEEQEQQQEHTQQQDDDALAATAQELLEKVENNQTDKFLNSQFLGLMRKLRDREVKVEGDKMVEVDNVGASTEHALNAASTTTNLPRFDNLEQRPFPLAGEIAVDTRPPDYGIPANEQDADLGRVRGESTINTKDGSAVVDLLNEPAGSGVNAAGDDIGTFASSLPEGAPFEEGAMSEGVHPEDDRTERPYYGDLRTLHGARSEGSAGTAGLSEMLYGHDGTLEFSRGVTWSS